MKQAAVRAGARDWQGAPTLWQQADKNLNPKIAGRAFCNLAVASEVRGDLPGAIDWAKKSAHTCNNGQTKTACVSSTTGYGCRRWCRSSSAAYP